MVVVPEEFRSKDGISQMKLTGNLIAALRMLGIVDFDVDPEKWEAGIGAAIRYGQENGMRFNFVLMQENHLHHYASKLGLLYAISPHFNRYQVQLGSKELARDYFEHFTHSTQEREIYGQMAERFLEEFRNPRASKQDVSSE